VAFGFGLVRYLPGDGPFKSRMADAVLEAWANPFFNFIAQRITHNLLLVTIAGALAIISRRTVLKAIVCGWALHVVADLAFHVNDAYPVLWPITLRVFPAPISYWDPRHGGRVGGVALALIAAALWAWLAGRFARSSWASPSTGSGGARKRSPPTAKRSAWSRRATSATRRGASRASRSVAVPILGYRSDGADSPRLVSYFA